MKSRFSSIVLGCAFAVLAIGTTSFAVSTVTVGSANVIPGQQDVVIPVFLKNEADLKAVTMPLMIKKLGPAYVDSVQMGIGDRMEGVLYEIAFLNHYNQGEEPLGDCKRVHADTGSPTPGGFRREPDYAGPEKRAVDGVPYGILFARQRIVAPGLSAGWDKTGSFLITADISAFEGCFEIDTTCTAVYIHPFFVKDLSATSEPFVFSCGIVHVGECTGTALGTPAAASLSPDSVVTGPLDVTLSWEAVPEAGAYEIEIDTVDENLNNLVTKLTLLETEYPISVAQGQKIYWRVRAVPGDCSFCFGEWTEPPLYTDVQIITSGGIPESYILNQNYPNPFNASTVIEFTNKHDGNVTLEVFNILGQNVATLMEGFKPLGVYAVTWDGTDSRGNTVPSGMYYYRVSTDDFISVKKMTLLK